MSDCDVDYESILNSNANYILIVLNESLNSNKSKSLIFKKIWQNGNCANLYLNI